MHIYDQTNRKTLAYICSKCKSSEDAKDVFQDTYIEIYTILRQKGTDYIKDVGSFVRTIAKHRIYRYYLLINKHKNIISFSQVNKNEEELDLGDFLSVSDNKYIMIEARESIEKILRKKSDLTKKIFTMFYFEDKAIPEISNALNVSQSVVKNHIYRTIKEIKSINVS